MEKALTVKWTEKAVNALQSIYDFYSEKSTTAAEKMIDSIIEHAENIKYPNQYQQDEIVSEYRRMILSHYKILYKAEGQQIHIMNIFDTRQDPSKSKK